ncbi:MAG: hypothetical protein A3A82_03960 [Candidatus Pacebacteria bacterium RIFCSPLOWO2_01_FULL_47_12]|nr:MAG: hypothetical protein A3J60_00215 [Candidatus Pacebacteria bacterium RIFCSPHIGHO2_02_FULL_46_9]OGJ39342.1 MAG: hypothetical protein A3A82_03960 [Candidatus Pacebacteria bacterium RIFCSPLOWO2_01_FULL_47_12]
MIIFLTLIPLLALASGLFLYRHDGKREILRFDVVQFVYSFVIAPVMFVWIKSFFYFVLSKEIQPALSPTNLFVIDTILSTLALIIYAFIVIHSLTTSFNRKMYKDPLYDLFEHSEYFHLWLSHLTMYIGYLLLFAALGIGNIFFPLEVALSKLQFYALLFLSTVLGTIQFIAVWLSNPGKENFMRIMKLSFGLFFMLHVGAYFLYSPAFTGRMSVFWVSFGAATTSVLYALFAVRFETLSRFFDKFKHPHWGFRYEVLNKARQEHK